MVAPSYNFVPNAKERQFGRNGERLDKFRWNGQELVPVVKDFRFEHPNLSHRTEWDNEQIRLRHSINVKNSGLHPPKPIENFEELPFPDWAVNVLREMNFTAPTAIQVQAWPTALRGHDIIGIAETGSGKTMAYIVPMLVHIQAQMELRPQEGPVGLVVIHSRELCRQVEAEINKFRHWTDLTCAALIGGEDERVQADQMLGRVDVVVATPGRLISLLESGRTNLRRATYVVIDEADCLFGSSFAEQIQIVLGNVRPDRQVLFFSATWDSNVERVVDRICTCSPITIHVGDVGLKACKDIIQRVTLVGGSQHEQEQTCFNSKVDVTANAVLEVGGGKVLIFVNQTYNVEIVVRSLRERGFACEGFASSMGKNREAALARFINQDDLQILVSTSLLARGHDFQDLKLVINFDMPSKMVDYVHRVGRIGRAGKTGRALTLMEDSDLWIARQFVDCLRRTDQHVPEWLRAAARSGRHWQRPSATASRATTTTAAPTDALTDTPTDAWRGRGRGLRELTLRRLCGRGVARGR